MKCLRETIYQRFVDDELGPLLKHRVIRHVKTCERCREWVYRLNKENTEICLLFREDQDGPDLMQPIMEQINSAPPITSAGVKFLFPPLRVGLRIAAAFLLIALFLIFLLQNRSSRAFAGGRGCIDPQCTGGWAGRSNPRV